jgi:hypothetical protein
MEKNAPKNQLLTISVTNILGGVMSLARARLRRYSFIASWVS